MSGVLPRLAAAFADRYRIERELGQGGMATVYLAEDVKHERKVAIKVLKPELAAALGSERFLAEIRTTANLQHPNIVPLYDSGEADGFVYYVMPYIAGESLREKLAREQRLDVATAVTIARGVAQALATAHEAGIVHRDIKPENILLVRDQPIVADFGIARAVDAAGGERLTATGIAVGTPAYMSPEQVLGDATLDARSDLYSLGCVIYEMLAGGPPFGGGTVQALLAQRLVGPPPSLATVPPAVDEVVRRSLATAPQDRFATALALADALVAAASRPGTAPVRGRSSRPLWFGLAAVVVVAIVAALAWTRFRGAGSGALATPAITSLAVLPIENVGGDSAKEYLADGMTTEMANTLRQSLGLDVVGDLSAFRFKHTTLAPAQIANELHVALLLTGRMQSEGGRIRLQMQLNDAAGKLLWSKQYDRRSNDDFALEDSITSAVAGELRMVLHPTAVAVAQAGRTENPEAHDLYLRGMFEKNKLSAQSLNRAVVLFQQALRLDPTYAQAAAAMGFAYDMLADAYMPSHPYHELAMAAGRRALASDSMLAEAHVLYGFELGAANWDVQAGIAEMRKGLELNPNSPDGLFMYSAYLGINGLTDSAVAAADRLIKVDPLSPMASMNRALGLAFGGRFGEALHQDSITKSLDANVIYGDAWDGLALREMGRLNESVAAYRRFEAVYGQRAFGLAMTWARLGRLDSALAIIHELEADARKEWIDPVFIAAAYTAVGDRGHAMQWLQNAFEAKDWVLRFSLNYDSYWFRTLARDPQFAALKQKVLTTIWTS